MSVVAYLDIKHMASSWGGLPGFLFSLPLSVLVVTGYLAGSYATEVRGYDIHVTEYHDEYGYLICAFLNGLLFYPLYRWWFRRRHPPNSQPPPPPPVPADFKS